jgi:hypothetical protein
VKKNRTYVLLFITIVIWSIIGYQIYNSLLSKPEKQQFTETEPVFKAPKDSLNYELILKYSDPFLKGSLPKNKKEVKVVTPKKIKKITKKTQLAPVSWGNIVFYGLLENGSTTNVIASLAIDHQEYFVERGDVVRGDIEVYDIKPDSVGLLLLGELKYFKK